MPNIKSAKKRVKVNETKSMRNKAIKTNLKTVLKKATSAALTGSDADASVRLAIKKIDQAVAKGVMHKNTAARKKSSIARKLNNAQ